MRMLVAGDVEVMRISLELALATEGHDVSVVAIGRSTAGPAVKHGRNIAFTDRGRQIAESLKFAFSEVDSSVRNGATPRAADRRVLLDRLRFVRSRLPRSS